MQHYQAIVIGCGGLGCATLYRLAGRLGPGENTRVRSVKPTTAGVEVHTDEHAYLADRVVVTSDAWTNQVLADCGARLPFHS